MNAQLIVDVHGWETNIHKSINAPWIRNGSWCILLLKSPILIDQYMANQQYYQQISVLTGTLLECTQLYESPVQYAIRMVVHPKKTFGVDGFIDLGKYYEHAPVEYKHSVSTLLEKLRTPFRISHTLLVDSTLTQY
jgi:hypothetical protein